MRSIWLLRLFQQATAGPAFFVEHVELYAGWLFADVPLDFDEEFALVRFADFAEKGTILNAGEAVVQAGIGDFGADAIMCNIVDE